MKLTADMFDFEKYDYFGHLHLHPGECAEWFNSIGQWVEVRGSCGGLCRKPKPPPRYILLNEGEKLQDGDEEAHTEPLSGRLMWEVFWVGSGIVKVNQIWRRKAP